MVTTVKQMTRICGVVDPTNGALDNSCLLRRGPPGNMTPERLVIPSEALRRTKMVDGREGEQMKPRSLVFDFFGDYLRYRGGEVRLRGLVALMNCFDIPEPTVRVVVGRLRRDGWLGSRKEGRETIYTLTDSSWQLLDEGRDRIFNR